MSEENKPQIIIHKSNWAKQLIIAVVVLVFFFFAIGKNPSKSDFIQGCVKEYLKKEQSFGSSTSNYVSEITTGVFGSWFEPFVEREDYLIFSKFNVEIDNDEFKMKIKAFGFWGNIYFSEGIMERKEPVQSEMERDQNGDLNCAGIIYTEDESGFLQWVEDNGYSNPDFYSRTYMNQEGSYFESIYENGTWK
jgi:hypothetical protein